MSQAVGFLGAGQMATALARGWLVADLIDPARCRASDPVSAALDSFATTTRILTSTSNRDVVQQTDLLILAVKPQSMPALLNDIGSLIRPDQLVVSIAAGIRLEQLARALPSGTRIIRVMPNTPCLVGASATGIAAGPSATSDDVSLVKQFFSAVGVTVTVPESQLDAVTGLSGSGAAYVYVLIEALADGGVRAGLPRDVAMTLATQTVYGSAKMVQETKLHPAVLKDAVASPGGTTIAGLHALENAGFRGGLIDAVLAATRRATELGQS